MTTMTKAEAKAARLRLGMTQAELAAFLGLSDDRSVRRWEDPDDEKEISGPAAVAIRYALKHGTDVPPLPAILALYIEEKP